MLDQRVSKMKLPLNATDLNRWTVMKRLGKESSIPVHHLRLALICDQFQKQN